MLHTSRSNLGERIKADDEFHIPAADNGPSRYLRPSDIFSLQPCAAQSTDGIRVIELLNMEDHTSQLHCSVDISEPLFRASPPGLLFNHFDAFSIQEQSIRFQNRDRVTEHVRLYHPF